MHEFQNNEDKHDTINMNSAVYNNALQTKAISVGRAVNQRRKAVLTVTHHLWSSYKRSALELPFSIKAGGLFCIDCILI